jgi:hypothetical protein
MSFTDSFHVSHPSLAVRQISMHKWMNGVYTLQAFPSKKECWVESHWSGYVFHVERISPIEFLLKTYCHGSLVHSNSINVPEQVPIVDAKARGTLINPEESRIAYSQMLEAFINTKN